MIRLAKQFVIPIDHFQFFAGDRRLGPLVDTSDIWRNNAKVAYLSGSPELVGIGTVRYGGRARVQIEFAENTNQIESDWTKLGEFTLALPTGELVLWAPESVDIRNCPSLRLPSGTYQGEAYSRGTLDVMDEMEEDGPDEYRIILR